MTVVHINPRGLSIHAVYRYGIYYEDYCLRMLTVTQNMWALTHNMYTVTHNIHDTAHAVHNVHEYTRTMTDVRYKVQQNTTI